MGWLDGLANSLSDVGSFAWDGVKNLGDTIGLDGSFGFDQRWSGAGSDWSIFDGDSFADSWDSSSALNDSIDSQGLGSSEGGLASLFGMGTSTAKKGQNGGSSRASWLVPVAQIGTDIWKADMSNDIAEKNYNLAASEMARQDKQEAAANANMTNAGLAYFSARPNRTRTTTTS